MRTEVANCTCCGFETPCNPTRVPASLPLKVTFLCTQIAVTLTYDPTVAAGQPGWTYGGAGDVDLCDGFRFRDFTVWCAGGVWHAALVYTERNAGGTYIQQSANAEPVVTVSTNPLCLTIDAGVFAPASGCGSGRLYFAIGSCAVYPPCPCPWSSMPATATLTYTIGALAPATLNLTRSTNAYSGAGSCDVGDGHNVIFWAFTVQCTTGGWAVVFSLALHVDGVPLVSYAQWSTGNFPGGTIVDPSFSISTSPFHMSFAANSNAGDTTGGATKACGGRTYPFGTGISGTFDAVTP